MNPKNNSKIIYLFILIAMVLGVLTAVVFFMSYTQKQERMQMVYSLRISAEKDKALMQSMQQLRFDRLQSCARDYRIYHFNTPGQWKMFYRNYCRDGKSGFFAIGAVTEEGKTFSSLEAELDFADYSFVKEARKNSTALGKVNLEGYPEDSVFVMATAVASAERAPVIFALCSSVDLLENIDVSAVDMGGCYMLCDTDGDIMLLDGSLAISDSDLENGNFLNMLSHVSILGNDFQRISYEISTGIAGAAYIGGNDSGAYCSYYPLGAASLTVVNVIPENGMINSFKTSESDMWSLVLVVSIFAGAAIICIMAIRMADNQMAEKAEAKIADSENYAAKQREMLSFVLKNSSTRVWEYDVSRQVLIIQSDGVQKEIPQGPNYYIDNNFIHSDDIGKFLSLYSRINCGETYVFDEIRARGEGDKNYNWISLQGYVVLDDDNVPIRAMLSSRDISARREMEQRYKNEVQMRRMSDRSLVFVFRINLSTGIIEDKECNSSLYTDFMNCTDFRDINSYITDRIRSESERRRVKNEFTSRHMLHLFSNGISGYETEYRRIITENMVHWEKLTVTAMHSPTTDDIIGFVYIRDINDSKILELATRKTISDGYEYVSCLDMSSDMIYAVKVNSESDANYQIEEERFSKRLVRLAASELPMTYEQIEMLSIDGICRNLENNESYSVFITVEQPNGMAKRKKIHYSYIDREKGLVLLDRLDVTDVYQMEQQKNIRLTRALIEAERAKKARGDFLAHMSHEIRTPLNGIRGMLDIIKANPDDNLELYLDKAVISSKHLTGLINDILDMSRIDSGKMELACELVEFEEVRNHIDAIVSPLAEEKKQKFRLEFDCGGYFGVYTDEMRIKQVFINLLSNAVKYTPNGGEISCWVSVSPCDDGENVMIHSCVTDNGIGMNEKFVPHAFEPFAQAEKSFDRKGTGLGLVITKSIIDMMGGSISIDSHLNEGTQISFDVKLKGEKFSPDIKNGERVFSGIRAMVADDHDINLIIAEKMLTSLGLEVICANNGKEALELFMNSPTGYFDIILMDMMMPVMDGMKAATAIRFLDRSDAKTVRIVAMTANTFTEYDGDYGEIDITESLSKPYSREQLIHILLRQFGKSVSKSKENSSDDKNATACRC